MPDLTTSPDIDAFLAAANDAAARTELGLGALATITPAAGIATFLATPSSANLRAAVTDESGTGALLFAGGALGTPASGVGTNLTGIPISTGLTGAGTGVLTQLGLAADGSDVDAIGFRGIPQNAQTGNYTCVMADAGKCIFHASGAGAGDTYTIPANGSVAYEIGTVIKFKNMATDAVTIAITTDTMTLLPAGTTGSRTLAQYGEAYAEKISATAWTISGNAALT
jgi:hypothetical protein